MSRTRPLPTDAQLDGYQQVADPVADGAMAKILGPWPTSPPPAPGAVATPLSASAFVAHPLFAANRDRIDEVNRVIRDEWQENGDVQEWRPSPDLVNKGIGTPLAGIAELSRALPDWAEKDRIERAERLFIDHGALSVTVLFCASLPECYVVPDLAEVLHATGQLEKHVEHRIRSTGAMIFPVMMTGGLTDPHGGGIAQILKVRMIHAMVRNLILRGAPALGAPYAIPPLAPIERTDPMHAALFVLGWDTPANGLPNNQEELAYTLLTFSFVFLRSMRRLGIELDKQEEEDYLHAWNVAGHFLGIRRELMADTMEDAGILFARMQARGRADWAKRPKKPDARPLLGAALMEGMKSVIPDGPFKSFPVLLTRKLMEKQSIKDLQLNEHVSWPARTLFAALLGTARLIDRIVRIFDPRFSLSRLLTRVIGYRLMCALLMSNTCPLSIPKKLRGRAMDLIAGWKDDPRASPRMNRLEDRWTTTGKWVPIDRIDRAQQCDQG